MKAFLVAPKQGMSNYAIAAAVLILNTYYSTIPRVLAVGLPVLPLLIYGFCN
ncbi:hypothetical protein I8751_17665 [Nostocaceae cyanobacterium CENA357]|uniref:Uncharacterized protein n=1 Tax=Atlanticothrix silvestris CENA357 TaxID=1725252 RepID=A0A8J7HFP5_9CYAN|nr:hypothetical protein [Atlanticothrix silvestris]MBH8554161.1 hypothetical protein [Atlanticothrix silvestris CENA357]